MKPTENAYIAQMRSLSLIVLMVVIARCAHALHGSIIRWTSFEELVHESSDIVVGSVLSKSSTRDHFRVQREYTLRILSVIKGSETNAVITVHQEYDYITRGDASPQKGTNYVAFLSRAPGDNSYRQRFASSVTQSVLLDAIKAEMFRTSKTLLPREFLGISMGDSIQKAEASSGLHFTHYRDTYDKGTNWDRYYTLMPTNSDVHMVQMNVYKGSILHLSICYHASSHNARKRILQDLEAKCGGTPLDALGDFSFSIGRRWTDENVDIKLSGPSNFIIANGYPWGVFSYYELAVTDQTVLAKCLREPTEN